MTSLVQEGIGAANDSYTGRSQSDVETKMLVTLGGRQYALNLQRVRP